MSVVSSSQPAQASTNNLMRFCHTFYSQQIKNKYIKKVNEEDCAHSQFPHLELPRHGDEKDIFLPPVNVETLGIPLLDDFVVAVVVVVGGNRRPQIHGQLALGEAELGERALHAVRAAPLRCAGIPYSTGNITNLLESIQKINRISNQLRRQTRKE